jgi:predicted RNA-binding Zn ribbon-like protein
MEAGVWMVVHPLEMYHTFLTVAIAITRDKFGRMSHVWLLPDERVAVRLMSTIWANAEGPHDELVTSGDLDAWLDAVGLDRGGARATDSELVLARELRDGVRLLAGWVTAGFSQADAGVAGAVRDDAAVAEAGLAGAARADAGVEDALGRVNAVAREMPGLVLVVREGRLERGIRAGVPPVTVALARVAADAIALLGGDDAAKLRACSAPPCVQYFVKTHPRREWCSQACGNRVRAARHYRRQRAHP